MLTVLDFYSIYPSKKILLTKIIHVYVRNTLWFCIHISKYLTCIYVVTISYLVDIMHHRLCKIKSDHTYLLNNIDDKWLVTYLHFITCYLYACHRDMWVSHLSKQVAHYMSITHCWKRILKGHFQNITVRPL